ncbi:hypothetical protein E6C27_scaffold79G001410 [Cucumis melo var. makuwa]|uniref:Uncharacterized protein n=1 Tax=Cucumis melo var. makuwa TaxID=1194695 RepID=A0A5A7V5X0_CUCMM|nr:hypothetical protein E6C27_scaffold79G001410 [Cucumis melo var. makuwa]
MLRKARRVKLKKAEWTSSSLQRELRKRQGEKEASGLKKAKIPKARDSKEIFPPTLSSSPTKEGKHKSNEDRVLIVIEPTETTLPRQEETFQPIALNPLSQSKRVRRREIEIEALKEIVDDPLQGEKEELPEDVSEKSLPSPPKPILEVVVRLEKLKEAMKEEEEVDANYVFKFMDEFICKPLERGFEDIFQCQSNLQEMQL